MKELPSLNSARIKLARADEHLNGLQLEFQRFNDSKPYRITNECNFEIGEKMVVYYPLGGIPDTWLAVIGEILFNLRSALDNAIYELTIWEQGVPFDGTEFPIFENKDAFFRLKKDGTPAPKSGLDRIRGLRQKTVDYIETIQPYNIRQAKRIPVLGLLHEMCNFDKHREVHLCRRLPAGAELRHIREISYAGTSEIPDDSGQRPRELVFRIKMVFGANLDERAILALWKPTVLDNEMDMDANVTIEIVFDKRNTPGFDFPQKVTTILSDMIGHIENIINTLVETVK